MKKIIALALTLVLALTLTACSDGVAKAINTITASTSAASETGTAEATGIAAAEISVEYDSADEATGWDADEASSITLDGDTITLEGEGAVVDENQVAITAAGVYVISGTLEDGQIIVNTQDSETVRIVLNGADITCSTSSPIYVKNAGKTVITLAAGTENYVTDGDSYIVEDSAIEDTDSIEPNAAIFSKDDLTINGEGSLTVSANYDNGIQCKDDLKILGGNITVSAVNDAIKGRDSIVVRDGVITVEAGGDGMQSNSDNDEKGFIVIESGTIAITAGEDGIQAETSVLISGGVITLSTGGGSANSSTQDTWGDWDNRGMGSMDNIMETLNAESTEDEASAKGIKAAVDILITGGTINIDSSDDSVHSNSSLTISGGDITLTSGDDGMHADATLEIGGGDIEITKSYEGIESSVITINGGTIHVTASDDGINVSGGNDGSSVDGRPGQNEFSSAVTDKYLSINGGYLYVEAGGDGIDANGSIYMTAGDVIVNGPTDSANGSLDYLGEFQITGGFLVAAGSSGMAQAPSTSSTQYSVLLNLTSTLSAGTIIHIETGDGEDILTFAPTKQYQSIAFSSPELENGATYNVSSGGSSTGTETDGLYTGGEYTGGTLVTSITITGITTSEGTGGMTQPGTDGGTAPGGGSPPGGGRR